MSTTNYQVEVDPRRGQIMVLMPAPRNSKGGGGRTLGQVGGLMRIRFRALGPILRVHETILKCLMLPRLSRHVPKGTTVVCPKEWMRRRNGHSFRKVVLIEVPCYAPLAIQGDVRVPQIFDRDLRRAIRGEMPTAEPLYEEDEPHDDQEGRVKPSVQDPADAQAPRGGPEPGFLGRREAVPVGPVGPQRPGQEVGAGASG